MGGSATGEPERDLPRGGLVAVRRVDQVLGGDRGEVAPDRARLGVVDLGGADHLPHQGVGVVGRPLDDHREHRRAGEEAHQLPEERLLGVLGVVLLGEVLVDLAQLGGHDLEALALDPGHDLADEAPLDGVGLGHHEGLVHGPDATRAAPKPGNPESRRTSPRPARDGPVKALPGVLPYLTGSLRGRNLRVVAWLLGVFAVMVAVYSTVFHVLMEHEGRDHSWATGVYWTMTTMSTLGFGDITFESDAGRLFSMVVLLSGALFILVLLPFAFIQFVFLP